LHFGSNQIIKGIQLFHKGRHGVPGLSKLCNSFVSLTKHLKNGLFTASTFDYHRKQSEPQEKIFGGRAKYARKVTSSMLAVVSLEIGNIFFQGDNIDNRQP
jgi:hypothetical protein